jgi:multiple sugar transport system ATP-binding protein
MRMGDITVEGLTKVFSSGGGDEIVAVDDLNLEIKQGEFVVFVGPSGCGKSTTLRCIAGLERVTEGRILLSGDDVTNAKPADRGMAMVFQSYALYPHMTARENMSFGLKMTTDLSKEEIADRVEEVAQMTGIETLLDQKPGELSGGQQQRVALGRAIVRDPEVFLMDEPLSNLDAKLRSKMRTELLALQQDFGVTTIYVTHDQTEAMTMGDRIVVLNDGRLQQIGTPLECYHEPANRFVAGFIGSPSMNFFEGKLEQRGDGLTFVHDWFEYVFSERTAATISDVTSDELTLGIRPEDVTHGTAGKQNAFETTVEVVEPLGESSYVYFDSGVDNFTASFDGNLPISSGDRLRIHFPEDRIHLFDTATGEAVKNRDPPETELPTEALVGD